MNEEFNQKVMEEIANFSPEKIEMMKKDFDSLHEKLHERHVKERLTDDYGDTACYECWFHDDDSIMCIENHTNCPLFIVYERLKLYEDILYNQLGW